MVVRIEITKFKAARFVDSLCNCKRKEKNTCVSFNFLRAHLNEKLLCFDLFLIVNPASKSQHRSSCYSLVRFGVYVVELCQAR